MNKRYSITGMTCAACSSGIERTVKKLNGVAVCNVSLMGESMDVTFDENVLSDEEIKRAVFALGYGAYDFGDAPEKKGRKISTLLLRFILSAILLVPEMYFSMGHMLGLPVPHGMWNYGVQIALTLAVLIINYQFFVSGIKATLKLVPNMDTLVTLGAAASFLYSLVIVILGADAHLFFESAAMIVTLVCLGKYLEDRSKKRTGKEVEKLLSLAPDNVTVERDGAECIVSLSDVAAGDIVIVKQGESLAVDGKVVSGHAFLDQSAITGESLPVEKAAGDAVMSASCLTGGYLKVKAEKVGEDTVLSRIVKMVREAGASKAPIQKLADRVAAVFVPVVVGIALLTFLVWILISREFSSAINYAVSVLVISCPCALGLATPVAIMAATGRGASLGILYKNAEALQHMANVSTVLLDKTATVTEGKLAVVHFEGSEEGKKVAYALESKLNHPLARCITAFCESGYESENVEYLTGLGARGDVGGKTYYLGNERILNAHHIPFGTYAETFERLSQEGKTTLFLADETEVLALFALADRLKEGSKEAIAALTREGKKCYMLTGDQKAVAYYIAGQAGIERERVFAEVLPEDKLQTVLSCKEKEGDGVAMLGDGINDSPALKEADVGIAMGNGTDIAIESADVVLVNGNLSAAPKAFALSKKTMRIIKQNLFWAFFYNCIGIPLAAGVFAFAGVALNPMIASAAMSCSSLFVVGNALRLTRYLKKERKGEDNMKKTLTVNGMMCMHCVKHVEDALKAVAGVQSAEVNLKKKRAVVTLSEAVSDDALKAAVAEAGYEVADIQ